MQALLSHVEVNKTYDSPDAFESCLRLFVDLDEAQLPSRMPPWVRHASSTQRLLEVADDLGQPLRPCLNNAQMLRERLSQATVSLDALDDVVEAFQSATESAKEASRLRLALALQNASHLPDGTTQPKTWRREWDALLQRIRLCDAQDIRAFADAAIWGDVGEHARLPMQPRAIQKEMVASLRTLVASHNLDVSVLDYMEVIGQRLGAMEADECCQALEAVGASWPGRYEQACATGDMSQLISLALCLVAQPLRRAESWAAARLLSKQAAKMAGDAATQPQALSDGQLATQAVLAILYAVSCQVCESTQAEVLHTGTLASAVGESAAQLVARELSPLDVASKMDRIQPLLERVDGGGRASIRDAIADAGTRGDLLTHASLWTQTTCNVLNVVHTQLDAIDAAVVELCQQAVALQKAWANGGERVAGPFHLNTVVLSADQPRASLLRLWSAACLSAASDDALAALPLVYTSWRTEGEGSSLEHLDSRDCYACALAAAHRTDHLAGFAAICAVLADTAEQSCEGRLPEETEVATAELPSPHDARPLMGLWCTLLALARGSPEWTDTLERLQDGETDNADLDALGGLGMAALTRLILVRNGARALGQRRPALLEAVLDMAVDLEAGVNWALSDFGVSDLRLSAEAVAAQLDPVTAGVWLLRARGFGSGCRSLQASLAMAEELPQ